MVSKLRIHGIVPESIVDGPGLRYVVFTQGCPHHCKGCHNPQTHPFEGGRLITIDEIIDEYKKNPLLSGITFSGGEPFCQSQALWELGQAIQELGGNVITYTGFLYEDLEKKAVTDSSIRGLLSVTDLLVDGPYIEEQRSLDLPFRGSRNQRLLSLTGRIGPELLK